MVKLTDRLLGTTLLTDLWPTENTATVILHNTFWISVANGQSYNFPVSYFDFIAH